MTEYEYRRWLKGEKEPAFFGDGKIKWVDSRTPEEWEKLRRESHKKQDLLKRNKLILQLSKKPNYGI